MRLVSVLSLIFLLAAFARATSAASYAALVPPSEKIAGLTQAEWSRAWWQWAGSFAEFESPISDRTGANCQAKQSGPVWFLAGTYETRRTIRTCTVPAGKYLFFPLINYVVTPQYTGSLTCSQAKESAKEMTDDVSSLVLDLDGKRMANLESHRQATLECFDLAALTGGGVSPAAGDGYYIMLRPLKRGTHTLNFGGILPSMSQAITYTLHVE